MREESGVDLVLFDPTGRAVAATVDDSARVVKPPAGAVTRASVGDRTFLGRSFELAIGAPPHATLAGLVPTLEAERTIAELRITAALLGALGLALAVALALLWSMQLSRPVERLAAFSDRVARGAWDEPLELQSIRELETLVAALDRMRADLVGYRERLVTSERHAAWGQMARAVAHEVRNPLTPIAISVADLQRSHAQGRPDFPQILEQSVRTISEELTTLQRLLHEFSEFGRLPEPRFAPCPVGELLADLETLYAREVADGRLAVARPERGVVLAADAGQLRQALINLVKNGLEAAGASGHVVLRASPAGARVRFEIVDDGPGMTPAERASLFVPGYSTKPHGNGLGLAMVERIVHDHGGTIAVESVPGRGTTFRVTLPIERAPANAAGVSRA
jgi:nitrogen fixation/metabolism regulation signal transduction histidine kinase